MSIVKKLVPIDFSTGVRSEKIQYNFEAIEDQMANDRVSTFGYGIAEGLDIVINDFDITVTEGIFIDTDGYLSEIENTSISIPRPRLTYITEQQLTVMDGGQISLSHIPYETTRKNISIIGSDTNGIKIVASNGAILRPRIISDNNVYVDSIYKGYKVNVSYYYTNLRYDFLYLDNNNELRLSEGTTSASPSILPVDEKDIKLKLAYLFINPFTGNGTTSIATVSVLEDLREYKKIYYKDGVLYICGVPFHDLNLIYYECPANPKDNTLWYDIDNNQLKVWREVDGIYQWVSINNPTIFTAYETKLWTPDILPDDRQYFIFSPDEPNMHFNPKRNELSVNIDQQILQRDQYEEITFEKALADNSIMELLEQHGYENIVSKQDVINSGVGFKLNTVLSGDYYCEATVTHRATDSPALDRFQRSATFVTTGWYAINSSTPTITLQDDFYRYGENQLEVFLNGILLIKDRDYIEGTDLTNPKKGNTSKQFKITRTIPANSICSYRISTNIYSYDHINGIFENIDSTFAEAINETKTTMNEVYALKTNLEQQIYQLTNNLKIPKSNIDKVFVKDNDVMEITWATQDDYFTLYDLANNKVLVRYNVDNAYWDYKVETIYGITRITFNTSNSTNYGNLYATGIKY